MQLTTSSWAVALTFLSVLLPSTLANYNVYQYSCYHPDGNGVGQFWDFAAVVPHKGLPCKNYYQISGTFGATLSSGDNVAVCRQRTTFRGVVNNRLQVESNISPSYSCWNAAGSSGATTQFCNLPGVGSGSCWYYLAWSCTTDVCSGDWTP